MTAEVTGEIVSEEKVLVIRKVHVVYRLDFEADREIVDRVHQVHHQSCPVYRSLYRGIEITTAYRWGAGDRSEQP